VEQVVKLSVAVASSVSRKAVSDRFISPAMSCLMLSDIRGRSDDLRRHTAAGLPPKGLFVKASTW